MTKLLTFIIVGSVVLASPALAAHHEKGAGHHKGSGYDEEAMKAKHDEYKTEKMKKLSDELSLTADQKIQVQEILDAKWEKKHEIMKAKHEQMDALREETHAKIKAVLTEEQQDKFEEMKKEDKGSMMKGSKGSMKEDHKGSDSDHGEHKGSQ